MPSNAAFLKLSRQVHLYFGLLISPALLFFAFTGAVQTLSLHEAAGSSYKPPAVLAVWGQIHKKQTWMLPVRRPGARDGHEGTPARLDSAPRSAQASTPTVMPDVGGGPGPTGHAHHQDGKAAPADTTPPGAKLAGAAATAPSPAQPPQTLWGKQKQHLPLKLFFLVVSLGLFTNTLSGVYMAYKYDRNKLLVTGLLVAGVVIPLVLLPF